jgi:hypothetical protein
MIELEDQHRFTVQADEEDVENLLVVCERCGEDMLCCGVVKLADLNAAAAEHVEVCR